MKTPDEIKKGLECCARLAGCGECPYRGEKCALTVSTDTLAYIKQLEAQIPKWISVEERLPEDDVNVLIFAPATIGDDAIAMTSYTHNMHGYHIEGWRTPWQYFFYDHTITHWMYLPKPPKEG